MATQTGSIDLTATNGVHLYAKGGFDSAASTYATQADLNIQADRIGMVVSNSDASSSLQLTSQAMQYIGGHVEITDDAGTSTVISGGKLHANAISIGDLSGSSSISDAAKIATNYITADSSGIKIHDTGDTSNYQHLTSSGTEIYQGGNSVAKFGATSRIGKASGESRMELDYHSLQLIDKEGNTYFHVSDLVDADGFIVESFVGNGSTKRFEFSLGPENASSFSGWWVSVDGVKVLEDASYNSAVAISLSELIFTTAPSDGASISVRYELAHDLTALAKAFTLGSRADGSAIGIYSYSEGRGNSSSSECSHAEGRGTTASGLSSHAEGSGTYATGNGSHAEGYQTSAYGGSSHAEGWITSAGETAHSEGWMSKATGTYSHAEGYGTLASGAASHAEGYGQGYRNNDYGPTASGDYSHAQNYYTVAASDAQTAMGKCNVIDDGDVYALIIGNGSINAKTGAPDRSNAFAVKWDGGIRHWTGIDFSADPSDGTYYGDVVVSYDSQGHSIGYMQVVNSSTEVYRSFAVTNPKLASNNTAALYLEVLDDGTRKATLNSGLAWPVANGGTGATTVAAARTNLGLGSFATKSSLGLGIEAGDASATNSSAQSAGSRFTVNITVGAKSGKMPIAVAGVWASNNQVFSRGFDLDGISTGGSAVVKTYWQANAAITASQVTFSAQVIYLQTSYT